MQNVSTKTAKTTKTTKAVKPAKTAKAQAAPKPFVHVHADSGVTASNYAGLSSYLNKNRKPRVAIGGQHSYQRNAGQLTPRTIGTLQAIRDAYGTKQFHARGFDNAVLAMLHSAGLIRRVENTGNDSEQNGALYAIDGAKPLQFALTAAGRKFGKA